MKKDARARLCMAVTMALFGTIGVFRSAIPLPSGLIAAVRGLVGTLFLAVFMLLRRQRPAWGAIRHNALPLVLSGAVMGFNWILLFEAYRFTTVATATLCYYMAPLFVLAASPLVLKERLTGRRVACLAVAAVGMLLVSGMLQSMPTAAEGRGILLGLGAAALYATVILLNKRMPAVPAFDRTVVQLAAAAVVLVPYTLLTEDVGALTFTGPSVALLLTVGVLHTGVAYVLYFGSMAALPAQTVALYSYLDPLVALLLSVIYLREPMSVWQGVGAVLLLGATLISELIPAKT